MGIAQGGLFHFFGDQICIGQQGTGDIITEAIYFT
jgi:hypothetical protein